MELWLKKAIEELFGIRTDFCGWLGGQKYILISGYKHLQVNNNFIKQVYLSFKRSQPIRFAHWLMHYCFFFQSDCDWLRHLYERKNASMPLDSDAISGNPFEINREKLAQLIGFKSTTLNSMNSRRYRRNLILSRQWFERELNPLKHKRIQFHQNFRMNFASERRVWWNLRTINEHDCKLKSVAFNIQ